MQKKIFLKSCLLFLLTFFLGISSSLADLISVETALMNQDFKSVESLSKNIIAQKDEDLYLASYYLGLAQLYQGQYGQAQKSFTYLAENNDLRDLQDKASLGLIDIYFFKGDYESALEKVESFMKENSRSSFLSLAMLKRARLHLKMGHWDEAVRSFQKIINLYPDSLEVETARKLLKEKHYFAVQVGAFTKRESAQKIVSELVQKGEYVYIVETTTADNKSLYRVRAGKLSVLDQAKQLKSKLARLGYPTQIYP